MQKKAYPIGKLDFRKRKTKDVGLFFLFQNGGYRITKPSPRKVRQNSGKIKFDRKNRHSAPSSPTVFVGVKIARQPIDKLNLFS